MLLPEPTPVQLDIADYLANGGSRIFIQGFRGLGKSFLTSAFAVWCLWRDPNWKVMIVSAGEAAAIKNATLIRQIIHHEAGEGLWDHLKPQGDQRSSTLAFDVGPAKADRQPSVSCIGITGQLPNNRADLIIADDIEVQNNSATEDMRDKLRSRIGEFSKILKPDPHCRIIYLGTPQSAESIYNGMVARGYRVRIWPARYPLASKIANYGDLLAPMIAKRIEADPSLCTPTLSVHGGQSTDPDRFSDEKLLEAEMDGTAAEFMLQMMLDTALSDAVKYPLKTSDLIVTNIDLDQAPVTMAYGSGDERQIKDPNLPNFGFIGDRFHSPFNVSQEWTAYTGAVMHIDPSGTGQDETAYVVTRFLNGKIYVSAWGGLTDGASIETCEKLVEIAKAQKVNTIVAEDTFGDGMFRALLQPILNRQQSSAWRCGLSGVKYHVLKEKRIINALEPSMKQHRLVFDREVLVEDLKSERVRSGVYQMTHISAVRGSLKHDDRIDVLAMGVAHWQQFMSVDEEKALQQHREKLDREFEDRFFNQKRTLKNNVCEIRRGLGRRVAR
ncbi:phage terminase large subunit [Brevundimonas sp. BH3]|uniref:phage terminase large subunit n=1 Tax=Brevundimonas sp. BH3 TaxID=3133089 RepID=UPI003248770F